MKKLKILLFVLLLLLLTGCELPFGPSGPSAEELAETYVAQTADAASPTPLPTDTPLPTSTFTATSTNTEIPTDTNTPEPPTETPTDTPIPGPITYYDDFETDTGNWSNCTVCEWADSMLYMGPYPVKDSYEAYYAICEACGTPTYYRVAVDATYVEGPTDRGFGFLLNSNSDGFFDMEITTWQVWGIWVYDAQYNTWSASPGWMFTGALRASYGTNHIQVRVEPTGNPGYATVFFDVNGSNVKVLYNFRVEPGDVGLLVGFHSIGVVFDNFEFEEIEP